MQAERNSTMEASWLLHHCCIIGGQIDNCPVINWISPTSPRAAWTYNQGVILGGLTDLYTITGEAHYLQTALDISMAAMVREASLVGGMTHRCTG